LEVSLEKIVVLELKKRGKNTAVKINKKEIKEVINLSTWEAHGKIQNKTNERTRKASELYHLAKNLLWN
jgi:hypothetical protein